MNKLRFIGILLVGIALVFSSCDQLILQTRQGLLDSTTQLTALTVTMDGTDYVFEIDEAAATVKAKVLPGIYNNLGTLAKTVSVVATCANGGKIQYAEDDVVDLSKGGTITVTSLNGKFTKNYALSWVLIPVPSHLYIIGDAAGSWDEDKFEMAKDSETSFTCITNLVAGAFKLRNASLADKWSESYGKTGTVSNIDIDGDANNDDVPGYTIGSDNVPIATAGTYLIRIDFNKNVLFVVPVVSFGIIGDGTPGGWAGQTNMTFDSDTDVYTVTATCTTNGLLFRVNDNWDMAFGLNKVTSLRPTAGFGGGKDNLTISSAGDHTITFNGRTLQYAGI